MIKISHNSNYDQNKSNKKEILNSLRNKGLLKIV